MNAIHLQGGITRNAKEEEEGKEEEEDHKEKEEDHKEEEEEKEINSPTFFLFLIFLFFRCQLKLVCANVCRP